VNTTLKGLTADFDGDIKNPKVDWATILLHGASIAIPFSVAKEINVPLINQATRTLINSVGVANLIGDDASFINASQDVLVEFVRTFNSVTGNSVERTVMAMYVSNVTTLIVIFEYMSQHHETLITMDSVTELEQSVVQGMCNIREFKNAGIELCLDEKALVDLENLSDEELNKAQEQMGGYIPNIVKMFDAIKSNLN
jgi:hypothetical protein